MNGNIILLQTHRFITDNENARSLAGSFEFKSDTYCLTNIAEIIAFIKLIIIITTDTIPVNIRAFLG